MTKRRKPVRRWPEPQCRSRRRGDARHGAEFEGDTPTIEWRSRFASGQNQAAQAVARRFRAPRSVQRFAGVVVMAAAISRRQAGIANLQRRSLRRPLMLRLRMRVGERAMPGGSRRRRGKPPRLRPDRPALPGLGLAERTAEIAQRLTIGAGLMASGDIAAARTMFERVAEAGEAAGAFALAETYDPVVFAALRLRGGITADFALAQRWYERAGDLGSAAAPERIARLAQILN
jgi:TPR repeat protein